MVSQFSVVTVKMTVENVFSYFIKRSIIYECGISVSKLPGLGFYQGSTYSEDMLAKAVDGSIPDEPKKEPSKQLEPKTNPGARILDRITQNPIGLEEDFMGIVMENAMNVAKRRKIMRPKDAPEEKKEFSSEKKEEPSVGEVPQIQEVSPKLDEAKLEADSARKLAKFMDNVIDNVKVQFEKKLSKKERRTVNYANATSYSEDDSAFAGKEEWDQRKRQIDRSWEIDFANMHGGWLDDDEGRRPLPESRKSLTRFEAALSKDAVLPEIQEQQIPKVADAGYAARLGKMKVSLFHVITEAGVTYNSTTMGFAQSACSRDPFVYTLCSEGKSLPMLAPKPGRYELFFIDQNGNKRKGEGEVSSDGYLQHTLDTHNGDCGRPIFALVGRTYKAIALHAFTANDHNWGYIFSSELLTTVSSKDSNLEDRRSKVIPADPSKNDRARHEGGGRGRGDRWSKRW
jgi:hypothetical protein